MSDQVRYGNINKELQNGSYVGRDKYPNTSVGSYEFMIRRSVRYQSIRNGGNIGVRGNSNFRGNQYNQRRNIMFLQKDNNGGNSNGCPPEDQLVPGNIFQTAL